VRLPLRDRHDLGQVPALGPLYQAMISAFLLARSAFGLLAGFFALPTFFAGLDFSAGGRLPFAAGTPRSGVALFAIDCARVHHVSP
jgi:hypothetical protein